MTILTFKTNIRFKKDVAKVAACLQQYAGIVDGMWTWKILIKY